MQLYKLSPDALKFFDKEFHNKERTLDWWKDKKVTENALILIPPVYIKLGIKKKEIRTDLSGWQSENMVASFDFTVFMNGVPHKVYDNIDGDKLAIILTEAANRFYESLDKN